MRVRATLTSKGQVTVPLEVRRRLGLEQGDGIDFVLEDDVTILVPVRRTGNPFLRYAGVFGTFASEDEAAAWVRELRDAE